MKTRVLAVLCVLMACCVGLVMPQQACGVTTTFTGAIDNEYDNSGNWTNGIPANGDTAVIDTGKTCNLDVGTATLEKLEVKSTANLNVKAGGTLNLNPASSLTFSTVSGTVTLETSTSKIAVLVTMTMDGAGKIVGSHNDAEIAITAGKVLTNATTIEGKLKITGDFSDTKFINGGTVRANVAGTLWVNARDVDDTSSGIWETVTSSSAILRFDPTISGLVSTRHLEGAFNVAMGTLDVDFPGLDTPGTLTWTGGTIDCSTSGGVDGGVAIFTGS